MANKRRALIVDDERLARFRMRNLLQAYSDVEVIGEAKYVYQAAKIVENLSPDLIFLDVQMPGGNGLDLFELCEVKADVVLVTAHNQHAIRAFEKGAVDYLLKPVAPARLAVTMRRLEKLSLRSDPPLSINAGNRISVISSSGLDLVSLRKRVWGAPL